MLKDLRFWVIFFAAGACEYAGLCNTMGEFGTALVDWWERCAVSLQGYAC